MESGKVNSRLVDIRAAHWLCFGVHGLLTDYFKGGGLDTVCYAKKPVRVERF